MNYDLPIDKTCGMNLFALEPHSSSQLSQKYLRV